VKVLLGVLIALLLSLPAYGETKDVQEILLDTSVRLVKDVLNLEKRVARLEEENRYLRQEIERLKKMKTVCFCPQEQTRKQTLTKPAQGKRKIIIGTFKSKDRVKLFIEQFFKRTGYKAQFKPTECKTFGSCYVAYVVGDKTVLQNIRKLGYRDAFLARTEQ
jgi:vacuolar-type H+-ATPase subunit I/STV1